MKQQLLLGMSLSLIVVFIPLIHFFSSVDSSIQLTTSNFEKTTCINTTSLVSIIPVVKTTVCRERLDQGANILLEDVIKFSIEWDKNVNLRNSFFCDIINRPKSYRFEDWPEVDQTFSRNNRFNWTKLAQLYNGKGPRVFYLKTEKNFCKLFNLNEFNRNVNFKFIIIGPFGDGSNFGPFSGGIHTPFFQFKNHSQIISMLCSDHPYSRWENVLKFLDDDRLIGWITFQQNIDHPKVVSIPLGVGDYFIRYGLSTQGVSESLQTKKEKLIGVTFNSSYGDRKQWMDAVKNVHNVIEFSNINPLKDKMSSKPEIWTKALKTPRISKIIISPGGLGVGM